MQTFLPYADFEDTFAVLDDKRIGNQVYREGLTLARGGWKNHPASKMWWGYEYALVQYCLAGLIELARRGRKYWHHFYTFEEMKKQLPNTGDPWWLGDERLHSSHRAALLYKDEYHYCAYGWTENPALNYWWPTQHKDER